MVICPRCGQQNPVESRFCSQCGAQLAAASRPSGEAADTTSSLAPSGCDEPDLATTATGPRVDDSGRPADAASSVESEQLQPGSALLVVKRGPNAGSRYILEKEVTTAGRHPDSDIFLDDVTVSRRHAEFRRGGAEFTVHDVGSLNGTYVNRERIDAAVLSAGDEVQIGKFRLAFVAAARSVDDREPRGQA
jgi:hypothetical protein